MPRFKASMNKDTACMRLPRWSALIPTRSDTLCTTSLGPDLKPVQEAKQEEQAWMRICPTSTNAGKLAAAMVCNCGGSCAPKAILDQLPVYDRILRCYARHPMSCCLQVTQKEAARLKARREHLLRASAHLVGALASGAIDPRASTGGCTCLD